MPAKGKGKTPAQHKLCAKLPSGEQLKDLRNKAWTVGKAIGSGGFGLIYMADEGEKGAVKEDAQYVIKIEPDSNGPLYCELAFYQRAAKQELIEQWRKSHNLKFLGVPHFVAQGLHEANKEKLRFMVMPRCGVDLHALWLKADKKFRRETVAKIALSLLDALEYIHENEYVHADIKGANILCGHKDTNKLYLVDYGLAFRYMVGKKHYEYKPDPRKAHNGTIEYTSCDAHRGAKPSRRGDMEILGFVLLHWMCGRLPWEDKLTDCNYVRDCKFESMEDPDAFVRSMCPHDTPDEITALLQHATNLDYQERPDYDKLRAGFRKAIKSSSSHLDFSPAAVSKHKQPAAAVSKQPAASAKFQPKSATTPRKKSRPLANKTNVRAPPVDEVSSSEEFTASSQSPAHSASVTSRQQRAVKTSKPRRKRATKPSTSDDSPPPVAPKRAARNVKRVDYSVDDVSSDDGFSQKRRKPAAGGEKLATAAGGEKLATAAGGEKLATAAGGEKLATAAGGEKLATATGGEKQKAKPRSMKRKKENLSPQQLKPTPTPRKQKIESFSSSELVSSTTFDDDVTDDVSACDVKHEPNNYVTDDNTVEYDISDDASGKDDVSGKDNVKGDVKDDVTDDVNDDVSSGDEDTTSAAAGSVPTTNDPKSMRERRSRYSMAPLHTEPVLQEGDRLTGKQAGKHPVFMRKRKKKVDKSEAMTQTTPSLQRTVSRK